jgi:hypothetical protein
MQESLVWVDKLSLWIVWDTVRNFFEIEHAKKLTLVEHFFGAKKVREYILYYNGLILFEKGFSTLALNYKNAGSFGTSKSHF